LSADQLYLDNPKLEVQSVKIWMSKIDLQGLQHGYQGLDRHQWIRLGFGQESNAKQVINEGNRFEQDASYI